MPKGYSLTRPLSSGTSGRTLGTSLGADIPSNSLLDHFKGQGTDGKMLLLEVSLYLYVVISKMPKMAEWQIEHPAKGIQSFLRAFSFVFDVASSLLA